jgi:O-antigen/teichoic acid export membrane protein
MRLSHVAWNLGGLAAPLGVAILTIPPLITSLGPERFGLLALAWGLIGYAGALDLGMGRAVTQMASRLKGEGQPSELPHVLATAGRLTLMTGLMGALAIILFALWGGDSLIKATSTPSSEIFYSILLLAIALPAQAMSATYRGMNEAYLNFKSISILRAALGIVNFAGPYWVSLHTAELPWLIGTIVLSRLVALAVYRYLAHACLAADNAPGTKGTYRREVAHKLFRFGGWVTVTSVVGPILVQSDRFIIAGTISAAAVSIYVIPYEMVSQSLVAVGAISSVMFPTLARLVKGEPDRWQPYFQRWLLIVSIFAGVMASILALVIPYLLPIWIKQALEPESILIGQILCLGVFLNSIGSMYYSLLHAHGRSDVTAKIHLIELPLFIGLLLYLLNGYGVKGAAMAWVARMAFDVAAMRYSATLIGK